MNELYSSFEYRKFRYLIKIVEIRSLLGKNTWFHLDEPKKLAASNDVQKTIVVLDAQNDE